MSDKERSTEKILFISYHYPPDSQIGGKRISRLTGFFARSGWDVGLLTVKEKYYEKLDQSFENPEISEYRTGMFESARFLLRGIKKAAKVTEPQQKESGPADKAPGRGAGTAGREEPVRVGRGLVSKMKDLVFSLIWCPDDRQGWIPFGSLKLLGLSRLYSLLYSSGPPHSTHMIPLLSRTFARGNRWIAEFRDPWVSNPQPYYFANRFTRWFDRVMERMVVRHCDLLISVTEAMNEDFKARYPLHAGKMRCFPNGFDRRDYPASLPGSGEGPGKLRFYHAGSFDYGRNPMPFLTAVAELLSEGKLAERDIEVSFYGSCSADGRPVEEMIARLGLGGIARCEGYIPWKECIREMYGSHVLLLFNIEQPAQIPAKLYEYISAGKNILSISTGGITDRIIAQTRTGRSVSPGDIAGIKRAILEFAADRGFHGDEKEIERFDVEVIFGDLMDEIRRL